MPHYITAHVDYFEQDYYKHCARPSHSIHPNIIGAERVWLARLLSLPWLRVWVTACCFHIQRHPLPDTSVLLCHSNDVNAVRIDISP